MRWTIFERKGNFSEAKLGSETYRFNVWVFRGAVFLMALYFFIVLAGNNFIFKHQFYYSCPDDVVVVCQNPFYKSEGVNTLDSRLYNILMKSELSPAQKSMMLNTSTFMPGFSIGKKPDPKVAIGPDIFSIILILSFVLNHYLFNRGFNWRNAGLKLEEDLK